MLITHFCQLNPRTLLTNSALQVSNGKTPSTNQHSSPNIYELESNISKVAFESSVSLDTEGTKTPDVTAPDYGFAFNITMIYPQDKSGELKLRSDIHV